MPFNEPMIVQKLSTNLAYLSQRQAVLSQNIANIDTPGYRAVDVKKLDFNDMASAESHRLEVRTTSSKHLSSAAGSTKFDILKDRTALELKPFQNNVSLEEQMGKVSDVGAQHQLTSTLLHKYNQLYRTAVDNRGS